MKRPPSISIQRSSRAAVVVVGETVVSVVVGTVDGRATPVEEVAAVVGVDVEELRAARAAAATRQTMVRRPTPPL